MLTIDADAHVLETEETWESMDGAERKYRPRIVGPTDAGSKDEYWLVDGTLRLKSGNVGRNTPQASREMRDVPTRLNTWMSSASSIQVLYPTLFLDTAHAASRSGAGAVPQLQPLARGHLETGKERLRWAAVVPLMTMDQAIAEARFAKENGACGIFMRGTEGDLLLSDPYFFPLYEEASRLDLAICIHAANGSATLYNYYKYETVGFSKFKLNCVGAFHSIVMDRIRRALSQAPHRLSRNQRRMAALRLHRSGQTFSHQRQRTEKRFLEPGPHLRRLRNHRRYPVHRQQARRRQHRHRLGLRPRRQRHRTAGDS